MKQKRWFPVWMGWVLVMAWSVVAHATPATKPGARPTQGAATKPATRTKPTKGPVAAKATVNKAKEPQESKENKKKPGWDRPYLLLAYGATWLALCLYLLLLAKRLRNTQDEITQLNARLEELQRTRDES